MAAFGLKYFAELRSKYKSAFWRVEIAQRDYAGPAEQMSFDGSDPLQITWEQRGDEFFVPVKASEATIKILCKSNFHYISLFTSDPRKFRVSIYRNTVLYWRGYVVADLYSESFTAPPYTVSIKAVDGFNLLSNVQFVNSDNSPLSGNLSLWQLLCGCISLLELDVDVADWMDLYAEGMNESESPLRQVLVNMERFYSVYDKPTYRDVLELCLRPFAGQIFQSGGALHIRRAISLYNVDRPLSFYDVGSVFPSGWLITAGGDTIVDQQGEPLITTMSRERIDSMWQSDINVLGDESTLDIVPAIRRVEVDVTNKLLSNIFTQIDIYNLNKWHDPQELLTRYNETALKLTGDSDYKDTMIYFVGCRVQQSAYKMKLKVSINVFANNRSAGIGTTTLSSRQETQIGVEYGFKIIGQSTTYYLADNGDWTTTEEHIKDTCATSEQMDKEIDVNGFPTSGTLQMFIIQTLEGYAFARNNYYQSAIFKDLELSLDTNDDYEDSLSYAMNVNAANNSDLSISLPIADIPNIPNDSLIYSLYFIDAQNVPTRMWHTKGQSDYNTLVNHLMACALRYMQLPAKRIQGAMFTGKHIDMNTVVQDEKFLGAGFYINSIELSCLEDTYNSELVEMPNLLHHEEPAEGDDCVLVTNLPFTVREVIRCVNLIVMLSSENALYVYDTVSKSLRLVLENDEQASIYPADDSYALVTASQIRIIDYRGYTIMSMDREELLPATYMDGYIYAVTKSYRRGPNGDSYTYYLSRPSYASAYGTYRRSSRYSYSTLDSGPFLSIEKSFCSIAINTVERSYLFDKRVNEDMSLTILDAGTQIVSMSDYFLCIKTASTLKIYRRDTITEKTLLKSIACDVTCCDHTLGEIAYTDGAQTGIWTYRTNSISSVRNVAGSASPVKGLMYISGALYIIRANSIHKYIPS